MDNLLCGPHTSSICAGVLGSRWHRSFPPDPQKCPLQRRCRHHHSRTVFQQDVFFNLGTENNPMVPNQENMVGD